MSNPDHTRIDYLKYVDVEALYGIVKGVRIFSETNPGAADELYIREVTEQIEDLFAGRVGRIEYAVIVRLLRNFTKSVADNDSKTNQHNADTVANDIVKLVQGDKKMDKNRFSAMVYRRVIEAMNKAEDGAINGYGEGPQASDIAEETSSRIVNDVFGGKIPPKSEFVDQYYEMDPETEDVLHNGTLVKDGMKILLEDPFLRERIKADMSATATSIARMSNRWCTVEGSTITVDPSGRSFLAFVAVYEDGVKRKRTIPAGLAWIVKTDSVPRIDRIVDAGGFVREGTIGEILKDLKGFEDDTLAYFSVEIGGTDIVISACQYLRTNGGKSSQDGQE